MKSALILFAHGARDPGWAVPFQRIQSAVAARRRDLAVELAFLEFLPPALPDAVAQLVLAGHRDVAVAPMFLSQGGHLKRDLPQLLEEMRRLHPGVSFTLLPAIGDVDPILDAVGDWLVNTMRD